MKKGSYLFAFHAFKIFTIELAKEEKEHSLPLRLTLKPTLRLHLEDL